MIALKRLAALLPLAVLVPLLVFSRAGQEASPGSARIQAQDYQLKNGLRVILSEDPSLPLVTVVVAYGAGTIREQPGQDGLAYLLENLMFQGSENVGPLQHIGFIQKVGGELNATTTLDKALFYQTLPSNYLSLALWLESDRMKSLSITAAAIEKTRGELLQEQRDRLAADPYFESFARFDEMLYPDFLYGHSLLGGVERLRNLDESAVRNFQRAYYVPNNAVLCIVGDIEAAKVREVVARYFESIPPGDAVPTPPLPVFAQNAEVVRKIAPPPGSAAGFHLGYRCYPLQTGDAYALKLLEYVLLRGETSRLKRRLLRRDRTANLLSGSLEERRGVRALKLFCLNNNAIMVDRAARAIQSEIERLGTNPISQDELTKAKRYLKMDHLRSLSTRLGRALALVDAATAGKPLDGLETEMENYFRVNPPNIVSVVGRHFVPRNKVFLELGQ